MCFFEIPVFKYISTLWTRHGYSLVAVLSLSELVMAARCLLYALIPSHRPLEKLQSLKGDEIFTLQALNIIFYIYLYIHIIYIYCFLYVIYIYKYYVS